MNDKQISAMDIHGALSSLLFAVQEELEPYGVVRISYDRYLYLQIEVETYGRHVERVVDILKHGILWGPFQYHFKCMSHGLPIEQDERMSVGAMVDLSRSKAPNGPINFNNTPSEIRRRQREVEWGWHR